MSSEACPMIGGDGPQSYSQNSSFQKGVFEVAKEAINKTITEYLDFTDPYFKFIGTFRIADFGCSVGPNTFHAMESLIETIDQKYHLQLQNAPPLEFQVFFNDLPGNDFNTLFETLLSSRKYFASGVPGSFYTRLFPESTLHVGFSSYSLNWLSKVPKYVVDRNSPAWNKGSIYCNGDSKEVSNAYLGQFRDDLVDFLNARAQEIACGGLMVILVAGRPNGIPMSHTSAGANYDILGSCLVDAAKSGIVQEEEVDSFNLPLYYTTAKELEEIIMQNGCFSILRMGELQHPMTLMKEKRLKPEWAAQATIAVLERAVKKHFQNDGIVDKIFEDFTTRFVGNWNNLFELSHHIELYTVLKRIKQ